MNAMIGQYVAIDSFLHRLHPLSKMIAMLCFVCIILLHASILFYVGQFVILLFALLVARLPLKIILKSIWSVRYLFIFLFIFNLFFIQEGEAIWRFYFIAIYPQTVVHTVLLVFRLLLLTVVASLLTLTTKPLDLTYAIEQVGKPFGNLAHILAMILTIALRFIPTLQSEAQKITKAQQSRGATFDSGSIVKRAKHIVSLLIPLFVISFNRAETLAVAMELRGYNPDAPRTRYYELRWLQRDTVFVVLVCLYLGGMVAWKILEWR